MNIEAHPMQPHDLIETPGHVQPRLYSVQGIHLGATHQEDVIELVSIDRSQPDAHGEKQHMFVPKEMIEAGLTTGLFSLTRP